MPRYPTERYSKAFARSLRRSMTDEELRLWWYLRNDTSMKWRRQEPLGLFIVDFLCSEARLILEVDGEQHAGSTYDEARDRWLRDRGFSVLRFSNSEVNLEIDIVMDTIAYAIDAALP